jgi:signal peptidase I
MVYQLHIPFSQILPIKIAEPQRSHIITFDSIASDNKRVKKVIGIPGDFI